MPEYILRRDHFDKAWKGLTAFDQVTGYEFFMVRKNPDIILRRTDRDDNVTWWRHMAGHFDTVVLHQVDRVRREAYDYVILR